MSSTFQQTGDRVHGRPLRKPRSGRCRASAWLLALAAICWLAGTGAARAQDSELEYKVKAAFLYNFISFVEWPTNKVAGTNTTMVWEAVCRARARCSRPGTGSVFSLWIYSK